MRERGDRIGTNEREKKREHFPYFLNLCQDDDILTFFIHIYHLLLNPDHHS